VVQTDVEHLKLKEQTYQGSWKKRGGIGSFMMLARKWDRLENMVQSRGWDIFKNAGDGGDGTPLAEIRDLRRYLLLIEAELKSRAAKGTSAPLIVEREPSAPTIPSTQRHDYRPGTPENGGHHARQAVECERSVPRMPQRLDEGLLENEIDPSDRGKYISMRSGGKFIVNRFEVPKDEWEHLPRLATELNQKEWSETVPEYQYLYIWDANDSKWKLEQLYRKHWGRL
jgi:hypothetical protein